MQLISSICHSRHLPQPHYRSIKSNNEIRSIIWNVGKRQWINNSYNLVILGVFDVELVSDKQQLQMRIQKYIMREKSISPYFYFVSDLFRSFVSL